MTPALGWDLGAEGVSSRLAGTRQRPSRCQEAGRATSTHGCAHTAASLCNRQSEGRVPSAPGTDLPDTPSIGAQGIWHFSVFQVTGRLVPLSQQGLSLVKAISNLARFGICGLLASLCDPAVSPG